MWAACVHSVYGEPGVGREGVEVAVSLVSFIKMISGSASWDYFGHLVPMLRRV